MFSIDLQNVSYVTLLIIIHIYAALHILFTKSDNPTKMLLWLFVVIAMPIAGIIIYMLFGINSLRTMRAIDKASDQFDPHQQVLARFFKQQNQYTHRLHENELGIGMRHKFRHIISRVLPESLPLVGNSVKLLHDGTETYPDMLEAINTSEKSIHLQSYIIAPDEAGKKILDAMLERSKAGVDVKVMYDRFGSFKAMISGFFRKYNKNSPENFRIAPFVRGHLIIPLPQLRNHRKLLIVDGKTAFIGGVNIGQENDHNSNIPQDKMIHDLHCRIEGPAVASMQYAYLRDWMSSTKKTLLSLLTEDAFPEPQKPGDSVVRVIPAGPGQQPQASRSAFRAAADTARNSLWIFTPYFVPDIAILEELCMAALRGVDVRVVVPANNNHFFVDQAARSRYRVLMEAGVRIFEKQGIFSHCKIMMVDGEVIVLGSSNYDIRSFELNLELDIVIEHGSFIEEVIRTLHVELEQCVEIDPATVFNKSSSRILIENLFSLLSPIL
jgi:cardiolipin synthase